MRGLRVPVTAGERGPRPPRARVTNFWRDFRFSAQVQKSTAHAGGVCGGLTHRACDSTLPFKMPIREISRVAESRSPAVTLSGKRCRVPVREFIDETGDVWTVWTTFPRSDANVRPQYRRGWLSFQCESQRRRLVPIPESWEAADDDQLRSYLRRAHGHPDRLEARPEPPPDADEQPSEADHEQVPRGIARIRRILSQIRFGSHEDSEDEPEELAQSGG